MIEISNNKLCGDKVIQKQTEITTKLDNVLGIMWLKPESMNHSDPNFTESTVNRMLAAEYGAPNPSVHFVIDRKGVIYQLCDLDKGTVHTSREGDFNKTKVSNVDNHTISIMVLNGGECKFLGGRVYSAPFYMMRFEPRLKIRMLDPNLGGDPSFLLQSSEMDTVKVPGRGDVYVHEFTALQKESMRELLGVLVREYKLDRSQCGYEPTMFDITSKKDIGPHFRVALYDMLASIFSA